jgi:diguanylate cyclase (GGDEF)-like protein/PAS domain S-box-containing protein
VSLRQRQKSAEPRSISSNEPSEPVILDEHDRRNVELGLTNERAMLEQFFATTSDNVYFKDLEGRFIKVSDAQARWLGLESASEAVGLSDFDFFGAEHAKRALADEQEIVRSGKPIIDFEEKDSWKDGRIAWVSTTKMPLRDESGTVIGTFGISRDITKRKLAEMAVQRNQEHMVTVIATQQDVAMRDQGLEPSLLLVAERAQALAGADAAAILLLDEDKLVFRAGSGRLREHGALELVPPRGPLGQCLKEGDPVVSGELKPRELAIPRFSARSLAAVPINYQAKNVGVLCVASNELNKFDQRDSESLQLLAAVVTAAIGQDELKSHAALSEYQSLHDALTGLPNRTLFYDRINQALLSAERDGGRVAIAMMDLDRFKEINDTLGHASGDDVLKEIGRRLQSTLRASDTVARLGGDEYGLLLPKQAESTEIHRLLDKLITAIEPAIDLAGLPIAVEASIGVAFYPDHGLDVDELVKRADLAMYCAKRDNRPYAFYEHVAESHERVRLTLIGELRKALDRDELIVHYQPKATLATGRVESVEALVRWNHPERGLLPPVEFIPQAQETGLMKPLTLYVLDGALHQLRDWEKEDGLELTVSVNLATRNLIDFAFPDDVAEALERWGIPPERLELEISESTVLEDPVRTSAVVGKLDAMGVRLSIDDFGTGYSSLRYLRELPVSELKIDRSFVMRMANDAGDEAVVQSTIDLGRNLGLRVVAEGVESEQIWKRLGELGCDVAQGFYLARPAPAKELAAWLKQRVEV